MSIDVLDFLYRHKIHELSETEWQAVRATAELTGWDIRSSNGVPFSHFYYAVLEYQGKGLAVLQFAKNGDIEIINWPGIFRELNLARIPFSVPNLIFCLLTTERAIEKFNQDIPERYRNPPYEYLMPFEDPELLAVLNNGRQETVLNKVEDLVPDRWTKEKVSSNEGS